MTRHRHSTLERIARWLEPSAEGFAAAAAVYNPGSMLLLEAARRDVERPSRDEVPECPAR